MYTWLIPDGSIPQENGGEIPPHEAICFINPTQKDAEVILDFYFVDKPPVYGVKKNVPAERSAHYGLGEPFNSGGAYSQYGLGIDIPSGVPFSIRVRSNVKLGCQYTRVQTTKTAIGLLSVIPLMTSEEIEDD